MICKQPKKVKKTVTGSSKETKPKDLHITATPKNTRIGGDLMVKRDLTRFVKWPKYIRLQRQKRILLTRMKVPPAINQFSKVLELSEAKTLLKLLAKYKPETKKEKSARIKKIAAEKVEKKEEKPKDIKEKTGKKPVTIKYGLNHITTLVEQKKAKFVAIANDVDPIELVVFLPALCRKMDVPYCFIKGKERLGKLVGLKNTSCVALTDYKPEDDKDLKNLIEMMKVKYNSNVELIRNWGGAHMGIKSVHKMVKHQKAVEEEKKKKTQMS